MTTLYVPVPDVISKRIASPPAPPAAPADVVLAPSTPQIVALDARLMVRSDAAFKAPVRMAGLPLVAVILTPLATLTMIAVVSLPALYPAAVARVRMFTFDVFDVMSSVIELIAWPP